VFFCLVNSCSLYSALKNAASILRNSLCAPNREYTKIREIHIAPLHTDSLSGSCHNASIHQGSLFQDHIGPLKGHYPDNLQHNCHKESIDRNESIARLPQSTVLWNIQVSVRQIGRVIWQSLDQMDIFALFFRNNRCGSIRRKKRPVAVRCEDLLQRFQTQTGENDAKNRALCVIRGSQIIGRKFDITKISGT
jgi:hypothetical protein